MGRPNWSDSLGKVRVFLYEARHCLPTHFFSTYKISMPREDFAEPEGWTWEGFWDSVPPNRFYVPIIPTLNTLVNFHRLLIFAFFHSYTGDKDAEEVTFFEDDVFEYQTRAPATNWLRCESQYGDVVKYFS